MRGPVRRLVPVLVAALTAAGCELQEVMLAPPDDVIVVELFLRTDVPQQIALLHRTRRGQEPVGVLGAKVTVTGPSGDVHSFGLAAIGVCVGGAIVDGTCYAAGGVGDPFHPQPGGRYRLTVSLPDARRIEGETVVPGAFRILRPGAFPCSMPAGEGLEVVWSPSDGAWVYVVDAELRGLREALAPKGIQVEDDPFRLTGLSVSREDTTIVFPTELGVFDRFDLPRDVLLELQNGLPDGVSARIAVGAADRNFVNWARRGNFNPSGLVRVSSVRGDGVGVFGSLSVQVFDVESISDPSPPCS